jgi:hypothetical protein
MMPQLADIAARARNRNSIIAIIMESATRSRADGRTRGSNRCLSLHRSWPSLRSVRNRNDQTSIESTLACGTSPTTRTTRPTPVPPTFNPARAGARPRKPARRVLCQPSRFDRMSAAHIMKAADCVSAAENISDRAERIVLLRVAGSDLLASEAAEQPEAHYLREGLPEIEKEPPVSSAASRSSLPARSTRNSRQPGSAASS